MTAAGAGSFTIANNASVGLSDLTDFSFAVTVTYSPSKTATYAYKLSDVTSFSATLADDMLTSLALFTKDVPQVAGDDVGPAQFFVGSFPLANLLVNAGLGGAALGDLTFFHLGAPDQVPEPASLALLSIALVAIATFLPWQRRRLAA